jgi:hypothetical protein
MKEITPAAMPPCFERWCRRFDDGFKTEAQKTGFRNYLGFAEKVKKKNPKKSARF